MHRVSYVYLQMPIGWIGLGMTIIVYMCRPLGRAYFKTRGVKKNSVPYMTEVVLTNIPIESWIVYPYTDSFFMVLDRTLVLSPYNVEVVR